MWAPLYPLPLTAILACLGCVFSRTNQSSRNSVVTLCATKRWKMPDSRVVGRRVAFGEPNTKAHETVGFFVYTRLNRRKSAAISP